MNAPAATRPLSGTDRPHQRAETKRDRPAVNRLIPAGHRILADHGVNASPSRVARCARDFAQLATDGAKMPPWSEFLMQNVVAERPLPRAPRNLFDAVDPVGENTSTAVKRDDPSGISARRRAALREMREARRAS